LDWIDKRFKLIDTELSFPAQWQNKCIDDFTGTNGRWNWTKLSSYLPDSICNQIAAVFLRMRMGLMFAFVWKKNLVSYVLLRCIQLYLILLMKITEIECTREGSTLCPVVITWQDFD
jgi:hypothetical protein